MNIAINGFGRIGRQALRIIQERSPDINVVLINDLNDGPTLAHLFEWDSTYGHYDCGGACFREGMLATKYGKILTTAEKDPSILPHKKMKVDIVLECTGVFEKKADCQKHIDAGAKKVILSAPAKDEVDGTFVLGVNEETYNSKTMHIVSNASCTTNCLAPVVKVLDENFGVVHGFMTTVHSYTNDQRLLDLPHKDWRRARSAAENIIPTTTGAAKTVGKVIPHLAGKLDGLSIRVPNPTVSLTDFVCTVKKSTSVEEVNAACKKASEGKLRGIMGFEERPLVSTDFRGDSRSSIVDAMSTQVLDGTFVKVLAWYDNEWGYACRLVEFAEFVGSKL